MQKKAIFFLFQKTYKLVKKIQVEEEIKSVTEVCAFWV